MLVDYWDLDSESFRIDGMSLTIEVEDIYFITGLSRQGEVGQAVGLLSMST